MKKGSLLMNKTTVFVFWNLFLFDIFKKWAWGEKSQL